MSTETKTTSPRKRHVALTPEELAQFADCDVVWFVQGHRGATVKAKTVREMRREAGWSQGDLAREAGVSAKFVTLVEQADRPHRLRMILSLARALDCAVGELCK